MKPPASIRHRSVMKISILLLTAAFIFTCAAEFPAQTVRKPAKTTPKPVTKTAAPEAVKTGDEQAFITGAKDADGWNLYESKTDLFTVSFPPTPVMTDETDEQGKRVGTRYYNPEPVTPAKLSLTIAVSDLGGTVTDPAQKTELYNGWLEGLMSPDKTGKSGVKVLSKEFAIGNTFGMEVIVDRGEYRFHGRIVCLGSKFYQWAAGSGTPVTLTPEAYAEGEKWKKKFFGSFQLLSGPEKK